MACRFCQPKGEEVHENLAWSHQQAAGGWRLSGRQLPTRLCKLSQGDLAHGEGGRGRSQTSWGSMDRAQGHVLPVCWPGELSSLHLQAPERLGPEGFGSRNVPFIITGSSCWLWF